MEESDGGDASSIDFYDTDSKPQSPPQGSTQDNVLPAKRKADEIVPTLEKKRKLDTPPPARFPHLEQRTKLGPAIWQHIFLYCPLATLGRLLQVDRAFHSYLTDVRIAPNAKPDSGCLRLLKSESIWAAARNAVPKKPPKPLSGLSELQMWQLVWSKTCQFCGKASSQSPGEKIWQQGPGPGGVRIVWPFAIRVCGLCLKERCQSDASLLFSNAGALRPALPYALISSDQHYIPAYTLQSATTPAGVEIAKYYYGPHVDEILKELEHAQGLGSAATEEWSKGLNARGKERMKAAENWERWEVKYQWWSEHEAPKREAPKRAVSLAPSAASTQHQSAQSPTWQSPSPIVHAPTPTTTAPQFIQPRPSTIPPQIFTPQPTPGGTGRGERNLHDANEVKANRKADIERRCALMEPAIPANILRHMDSFKAALQIFRPMSDDAWKILKPRLLAQFPAAQRAEVEHISRVTSISTRAADRRQQEASMKEVKEVLDREWEEAQRPVREKLSAIADDFINHDWDHGRAVTYENSPKFAVDLLMYVRREFYDEVSKDENAPVHQRPERESPEAAGQHRPKLVLENMKWVYDNKLKPLTEQYRKELFFCYGIGCETNTRYYGFEGVIQHFGAKHTNAFSVGNVVVAWREAEWPEDTPFHPDPISVKHTFYPASSVGGSGFGSYHGGYSRAGTSTPHVQSHLPHPSPGPYNQYQGQYNGPFAPPPGHAASLPGFEYGHSYANPLDSYTYPPMAPPAYGPPPSNNGYMTSPAATNSAVAPPPPLPPQQGQGSDRPLAAGVEDADHRTNLYDKQVSSIVQMAQEIWRQTSGVKDLPNSLRIYVLFQQVIFKFQLEFNHEPHLDHLFDALSSHQISKALKNAPGLSCKACQDGYSHRPSTAFSLRQDERRTYTVLNLLSHFKSLHASTGMTGYGSGLPTNQLDWKEDMIELPSDRLISGLIHAPGMDDDKLRMIATVFPRLFPPPLPRIGVIENNEPPSPSHSGSKDFKVPSGTGGTPGLSIEKSGPSSLALSHTDSPQPPRPAEDEYDPQRPALSMPGNQSSRLGNRKHSYAESPPPNERRARYYAQPAYYVGDTRDSSGRVSGANATRSQLPRDRIEDAYPGPREYLEVAPSPRFEEYPSRRPLYRDHEPYYGPDPELVYTRPRDSYRGQDYGPIVHRYLEHEQYRLIREPRSREQSPSKLNAEANRFLEEFVPRQASADKQPGAEPQTGSQQPKVVMPDADTEDGSRYTPPPPAAVSRADDEGALHRPLAPTYHTASSTISNGSKYDEYGAPSRQVPTPDSGGPSRRPGPSRRRDRYHDYAPSRYYRYNVAREDPYARGASMSRSQSRRYERYEQQRRRLDQQDTPQPNGERDYDPVYSRDQSVVDGPPDDPYYHQIRHAPRDHEYIPVHDGLYAPRHRYAGPVDDFRGPAPVYLDDLGYEILPVPRDYPRTARGQYVAFPTTRYGPEDDPEHIQYLPISYDRPPPQRHDDRTNPYVYYEGRERAPPRRPAPPPGPAFEPESEPPYEPPEIKVESVPPGNPPEGP